MVLNETVIIISFVFVWLAVLTVFLVQMVRHYNKLTRGVTATNLRDLLEHFLTKQQQTQKDVEKIQQHLEKIDFEGHFHFQKLGIVRFNPFSDTGGTQSFTMALLDGNNNGIIMTSLYARSGNRWYIKHITKGACRDVELSKEEQTAIRNAQSIA